MESTTHPPNQDSITFENFPARIVTVSNSVSVLIYVSGFVIMLRPGWIPAFLYLAFVLALEYRLISKHCVNCYYWGKTCGFGKGRLSSIFFKKGDPAKFCSKKMSWKDMVPDLMVSLIPLIISIILMIIEFDFILLSAAFIIILSSTMGNAYVRGKLTCKHCRQRELGCPAEELFRK